MISDGGAQLRQTQRLHVTCPPFGQSTHARIDDRRRGGEIGLAELQVDDRFTCPLQRERAIQHFHHVERRDIGARRR